MTVTPSSTLPPPGLFCSSLQKVTNRFSQGLQSTFFRKIKACTGRRWRPNVHQVSKSLLAETLAQDSGVPPSTMNPGEAEPGQRSPARTWVDSRWKDGLGITSPQPLSPCQTQILCRLAFSILSYGTSWRSAAGDKIRKPDLQPTWDIGTTTCSP